MIDRFAGLYVGIATFYLALPLAFQGALGGQSLTVRVNAWRVDCLFVVVMVACRRLSLTTQTLRRILVAIVVVASLMLGFALWEQLSASGYNHFLVNRLGLPAYQLNILHTNPPLDANYVVRSAQGSGTVIRNGSLLADEIALGFYMVLPFAYGIERLRDTVRFVPFVGMAAGAICVVLSETRSAILSGAVVIGLSVWLAFRQQSQFRIRMVVVLTIAALAIAPLALKSNVRARFGDISSTSQTSDEQLHTDRTVSGIHDIEHHPEGLGLGANPTTGQRDQTSNLTISEDSYLQVGTELGIATMLAFIGMYLALLRRLWRNIRLPGELGHLAAASWLAGCGLFVGGFFLQIWTGFAVSMTFWGLAGLVTARHLEPWGRPELAEDEADTSALEVGAL